jgi:hypothetical protein
MPPPGEPAEKAKTSKASGRAPAKASHGASAQGRPASTLQLKHQQLLIAAHEQGLSTNGGHVLRKWYVCFDSDLQISKSDGEKVINYVNKPLMLKVKGYRMVPAADAASLRANAKTIMFKQPFKIGDKRINKTKTNLKQYIESFEIYSNINRRSIVFPVNKAEKWWLPAPPTGEEDEHILTLRPAKVTVTADEIPGIMAAVSTSRQAYLHLEKEKW